MKKLFYLLPILLFYACTDEETVIQLEDNTQFSAYPKGYFIETDKGFDTIKFEYQNNQVTKKIGEWIGLSTSTGYSNKFSKLIETHISYSGNEALVTKVSKLEGVSFPQDLQRYKLNGNQISEATFTFQNKPNYSEKYVYVYENNKIKYIDLLVTDSNYANDLRRRRDFYFNTIGNLDSVVEREATHDYNDIVPPFIDYKLKKRSVITFSNYDQSQNPFQNLGIFTDLYYKSLPKNNFRKTETIVYGVDGKPTGDVSRSTWEYIYENNEVKVLK